MHSTSPTVAVPTSLSVVKEVVAERTSANGNEADGRTRALPPTDMPATAIGEDTQRTATDDAIPLRVVAERNTPGMLPTLDYTSSSPELTLAATLTESLSSSPRPTTYVGVVLSNMGERAHATPLAVTPSPQSSAEPQPLAAVGLVMRLFHPTLSQRWGDFNADYSFTYPVGASDVPSSLGVVIDLTFLDDVFYSLQPALQNEWLIFYELKGEVP